VTSEEADPAADQALAYIVIDYFGKM